MDSQTTTKATHLMVHVQKNPKLGGTKKNIHSLTHSLPVFVSIIQYL